LCPPVERGGKPGEVQTLKIVSVIAD